MRIALGDLAELADPRVVRQALRGVDTVIHLAAAIRDQPRAPVEELNGLATARLLRAAEAAGVERFVFFSALGATEFQRTRFFRAKALAERGGRRLASCETTVFAPSIVYDRDDPWVTIQRRLALLPAIPISGEGDGRLPADLGRGRRPLRARRPRRGAGSRRLRARRARACSPTTQMARLIAALRRPRAARSSTCRSALVRSALAGLRRVVGDAAFATWEEAELMEVPMVTERGTADARALGVEPRRMADVLGAG